jgi:hypothetical protein
LGFVGECLEDVWIGACRGYVVSFSRDGIGGAPLDRFSKWERTWNGELGNALVVVTGLSGRGGNALKSKSDLYISHLLLFYLRTRLTSCYARPSCLVVECIK